MLKTENTQLSQSQRDIHWLYQKYSAVLLGYIFGVLQDRQKSEACLVKILSRFAVDHQSEIGNGDISWLKLWQYSRKLLPELQASRADLSDRKLPSPQQFDHLALSMLNGREKEIFCAIYYHGKSIGDLAKQLGESEHVIRSQFKVSFDKIRSARGN